MWKNAPEIFSSQGYEETPAPEIRMNRTRDRSASCPNSGYRPRRFVNPLRRKRARVTAAGVPKGSLRRTGRPALLTRVVQHVRLREHARAPERGSGRLCGGRRVRVHRRPGQAVLETQGQMNKEIVGSQQTPEGAATPDRQLSRDAEQGSEGCRPQAGNQWSAYAGEAPASE